MSSHWRQNPRSQMQPQMQSQSQPSSFENHVSFIRRQLKLNGYPFRLIPDDFILLLFTSETDTITDFQRHLYSKYGHRDYENFEFIGDTVLNFIIIRLMSELKVITTPDSGTKIKNLVTKNQTLGCLLDYKFLCNERIPGHVRYETQKTDLNKCADVFEAIIGGLYWYLDTQIKLPNAVQTIQGWLIENWPIKQIILQASRFNRITCPIPTDDQIKDARASFRTQHLGSTDIIIIDDEEGSPVQTPGSRHRQIGPVVDLSDMYMDDTRPSYEEFDPYIDLE